MEKIKLDFTKKSNIIPDEVRIEFENKLLNSIKHYADKMHKWRIESAHSKHIFF